MAVSKRTRFEVLRRDNFTCRYCRSTESALTVDHVVPVALGGTDEPDNLVAACADCNFGKASSAPDAETIADVSQDAIRWATARRQAALEFDVDRHWRWERVQPLARQWGNWDPDRQNLPPDWAETVNSWLDSGLTIDHALEAHSIALGAMHIHDRDVFAYMCGIVRNWLRDLDERTAAIVAGQEN